MSMPFGSVGEALLNELSFAPGEAEMLATSALRMLIAMLLGGVLGLEREWAGKIAGLRTHMLTALGAALFVLAPRAAGMNDEAVSRILQGVIAGIGFLGGGVILKQDEAGRIRGVTTAAGIWLTSAIGICAGMGRLWLAVLSTVLTMVILLGLLRLERWIPHQSHEDQEHLKKPAGHSQSK
jgi:putative Mg2+ transporter-C (MgtC) family protein